jgi:lysophospholipase L1-like esterase
MARVWFRVSVDPGSPASASSRLSPVAALVALSLVLVSTCTGIATADPDYFLPNPFAWMAAIVCVGFMLTALIPHAKLRTALRMTIALPIGIALLIEIGVTGKANDDRIEVVEDRLLRYHYRPGWSKDEFGSINSRGLWDDEYAIPKPADLERVVILGDSVPNDGSIPFAERFHVLLEQQLGENVEVINVSCEGYSTAQEVRLLERVGLDYDPDVVVVTYVLNDPFIQNGGRRRVGHSDVLVVAVAGLMGLVSGDSCDLLGVLHDGYGFDVMVREPLERLSLLSKLHDFEVVMAPLPYVSNSFENPACDRYYELVHGISDSLDFVWLPVYAAFHGKDPADYKKPGPPDPTHPNAAGHALMAEVLAAGLGPVLAKSPAPLTGAAKPEP